MVCVVPTDNGCGTMFGVVPKTSGCDLRIVDVVPKNCGT